MAVFLGAHNIISPLGFTSRDNFAAVSKGQSGLQPHRFDFSETPFFCAKLNDAVLDQNFSALGKTTDYTRLEKMCLLSIQDVLEQSGLSLQKNDTLLILSTTKGNIDVLENNYSTVGEQRAYLSEFAAAIGGFFHCAHTPLVVSNACISGLLAMIIAKRFIEAEKYRQVIVCGADLVSEFTLSGFKSFNALSAEACKPFDTERCGINLGEAAASILISADPVSSIIISAGASANDASHISAPSRNGTGLYQAIAQTLRDAGKTSVDMISAHGTATEYNDEMESIAFSEAELGSIPLHSLKGYFGHTLGAAGVVESIIALESLTNNLLIRSLGFERRGTSKPLTIITTTEQKKIQSCLKTVSGFGGCNAAAVFEKI